MVLGSIFGSRTVVAEGRAIVLSLDYRKGRISKPSAIRPAAETQLSMTYAARVDELLDRHGVKEVGKLPAAALSRVNAFHAAIFEELHDVKRAIRSFPAADQQQFMNLHLETASLRLQARRKREDAESEKREKQETLEGRTDLVTLLGPGTGWRARLLDWLGTAPADPDLWHEIVCACAPDGMQDIYWWIVTRPQCDGATAATVFHANNSFEALDFPDEAMAGPLQNIQFRIAAEIVRRFQARLYTTFRFAFEQPGYEESFSSYRQRADAARARYGRPAFEPLAELFEFRKGEKPRSPYYFRQP